MKKITEKMKELLKRVLNKIKKFKKKQWIITGSIVLALIIAIVGTIFAVDYFQKETMKKNSSIDFSNPTYEGKEIIVEKDRIVIIEENGSKTIETTNATDSKFTKSSKKIKNQYKISDVKVKKNVAKTVTTGKIKNNRSKYTSVIINIKFYKNDQLQSSSSTIVNQLKRGTTKDFEIETLGDFEDCTYKTVIEYVG